MIMRNIVRAGRIWRIEARKSAVNSVRARDVPAIARYTKCLTRTAEKYRYVLYIIAATITNLPATKG